MDMKQRLKTFRLPISDGAVARFKAKCAMERVSMAQKLAAYILTEGQENPEKVKAA